MSAQLFWYISKTMGSILSSPKRAVLCFSGVYAFYVLPLFGKRSLLEVHMTMIGVRYRLSILLLFAWIGEYCRTLAITQLLLCPYAPRCGKSFVSVTMRSVDKATQECSEFCVLFLFPNSGLECGACPVRSSSPLPATPIMSTTPTPTKGPTVLGSTSPSRLPSMTTVSPISSLAPVMDPTTHLPSPSSTTPSPIASPSLGPSASPTARPSSAPRVSTTCSPPTMSPTTHTSPLPTGPPVVAFQPIVAFVPSIQPSTSVKPTSRPIDPPSPNPSTTPSATPTFSPTGKPATSPLSSPSVSPTTIPSRPPSAAPTNRQTSTPTTMPSIVLTQIPSLRPSSFPTSHSSARAPVLQTSMPIASPSSRPSQKPTSRPASKPSSRPSSSSARPSQKPSSRPSQKPTSRPASNPSSRPSKKPSSRPSSKPSSRPSKKPSSRPSSKPSSRPSKKPSSRPSSKPSSRPSKKPSSRPSSKPSSRPSKKPSSRPSSKPSSRPSKKPSSRPSSKPSSRPSKKPSSRPSSRPSKKPSRTPSRMPVVSPKASPTPRPSRLNVFDISFTFVNIPVADQATIRLAAERWEAVIVGDLSDQSGIGLTSLLFGSACTYPNVIDDFHLCIGFFDGGFSDGKGQVLGFGGPERLRSGPGARTPYTGIISLDPADSVDFNTVLHEMGHALGIGSLWGFFGLVSSADTGCIYSGSFANAEYRVMTGCSAVPVVASNNTCGHFSDTCLGDELMTATLPPKGDIAPLSRVSVGALNDLGYVVNYDNAESLPASSLTCPCKRRVRSRGLVHSQRYLSDAEHSSAIEAGLSLFAGWKMKNFTVALAVRYKGQNGTETVMVQQR